MTVITVMLEDICYVKKAKFERGIGSGTAQIPVACSCNMNAALRFFSIVYIIDD